MEKLTPEEAQHLLAERGVEVSIEQASAILVFMEKIGDASITNYLQSEAMEEMKLKKNNQLGYREPD